MRTARRSHPPRANHSRPPGTEIVGFADPVVGAEPRDHRTPPADSIGASPGAAYHVAVEACAALPGGFLLAIGWLCDPGDAVAGLSLVDLLVTAGLAPSKGEARRAIQGGGIYLNNLRVADEKKAVTPEDTIGGELIVLRKGRKEYRLVRVG